MNQIDLKRHDGETNNATSIRALLNVIFKRKYIIISVFVSVVATVTIGTLRMTPIYKASSKLFIEKEIDSEKSLLFRMNLNLRFDKYDWIKSEVEIMQSSPVIFKVIEELKLNQIYNKNTTQTQQNINRVLNIFKSRLSVENAKDSNLLDVSYESDDPDLTVKIINSLVKAYINYRTQLANESDTYDFFNNQIQVAEKKLSQLEERHTQFKQSQDIISPTIQGDILLTKLSDYEKALTNVRTRRIGKEAMLKVIKQQIIKGAEANIPVTESSNSLSRGNFITELKQELLNLELKRDELLQKYTPEYEKVINLEKAINSTKKHIEKEINQIVDLENSAISALKAEEEVLTNTINDLNKEVKKFAQKEYEFTKLSRGINDNRDIYSMLLKQREEVRISQAKQERGVKIKVISPALIPTIPIKPNKKLNILLAIILGSVSGFGLAFFVEYFDNSVNSPEEVEDRINLPVWASIKSLTIKAEGKK